MVFIKILRCLTSSQASHRTEEINEGLLSILDVMRKQAETVDVTESLNSKLVVNRQ